MRMAAEMLFSFLISRIDEPKRLHHCPVEYGRDKTLISRG